MISRSYLPVIFLSLALVLPASARSESFTQALSGISNEEFEKTKADTEKLKTAVTEGFDKIIDGQSQSLMEQRLEERKPATNPDLKEAIEYLPTGIVTTDALIATLKQDRLDELNKVPLPTKTDKEKKEVKYLVDTSWPTSISLQQFDIFMRYFCSPGASAGRMKTIKWRLDNMQADGTDTDKKLKYTLGCGNTTDGDFIETRHSVLGTDDTTEQAKKIIALPLRPGDLFFTPTTFPTTKSSKSTAGTETNTNPLAYIYFSAFKMSMQLLLGSAPDNGTTIEGKAEITKRMLASIPFIILFSERVGTMPGAAQSLAATAKRALGDAYTKDENIQKRMLNIQNQNTVSVAEYMDIMMYQIPTSPGYYNRISKELNPSQLRREEVWLTAMQTALGYQRNRWLEIQAALEAARN